MIIAYGPDVIKCEAIHYTAWDTENQTSLSEIIAAYGETHIKPMIEKDSSKINIVDIRNDFIKMLGDKNCSIASVGSIDQLYAENSEAICKARNIKLYDCNHTTGLGDNIVPAIALLVKPLEIEGFDDTDIIIAIYQDKRMVHLAVIYVEPVVRYMSHRQSFWPGFCEYVAIYNIHQKPFAHDTAGISEWYEYRPLNDNATWHEAYLTI